MEENLEKHIRLGKLAGVYLSHDEAEQPAELREWLGESEANQKLFDEMATTRFITEHEKFYASINPQQEYLLFRRKRQRQKMRRILAFSIPAAAAILIGVGIWYSPKEETSLPLVQNRTEQTQIIPGKYKAILITENNESINLDSSPSPLDYQNEQVYAQEEKTPHHRLLVPTGGEYQLILADGTKVWVNAGSELSYPIAFAGDKREVSLKGEAYFEVAHDKQKPFYVHTHNLNVKVTGTSFNVAAYPEETENSITLVEGSVSVLKEEQIIASLSPGKQLLYDSGSEKFRVEDADIESTIAWKNGFFLFREEPLSSIVGKLGRWYDVSFSFSTPAEDKKYSGYIRRDTPIDSILNILRLTNEIDFRIKENHEIEITAIQ